MAIANDDRAKIAGLDEVLADTFERILDFHVRNASERLAVGRFLTDYLATSFAASPLSLRASARIIELIAGRTDPVGETAQA